MRKCRKCKRDYSHERLNHKATCFDCQRATLKAKYKRIYAKRKEQRDELEAQ